MEPARSPSDALTPAVEEKTAQEPLSSPSCSLSSYGVVHPRGQPGVVGLHRVEGRRGQRGDGQRHAEALHDQQCVLAACKSLKGATMPNGQQYEEWLKDKEG
jgi:hypothetical protein